MVIDIALNIHPRLRGEGEEDESTTSHSKNK
jgi:hypothetical protein